MASRYVGQAIRAARRSRGLTQAQLAERLQTSAPYVSGLETGRMNPTVGLLFALAEALDAELRVELHVPDDEAPPRIPPAPTPS